jgi:hypothetical protein
LFLIKKFARRFVMPAGVIIRSGHRYLPFTGRDARRSCLAKNRPPKEITMRKTILTAAGSALIVLSAVQLAAASEHHRSHRADRATVSSNEQFRNSNAALPSAQLDWRYGGGYSAPAGR